MNAPEDGADRPGPLVTPLAAAGSEPSGRRTKTRANGLDGAAWTRSSISVWSDIRKGPGEQALKHPALFPLALPTRLIECFTVPGPGLVIDPFAGAGSTPLAAYLAGKQGLGVELSHAYVEKARIRCQEVAAAGGDAGGTFEMIQGRAQDLGRFTTPGAAELCVTSPPYWNILEQRRTADGKRGRDYGEDPADLGKIEEYDAFLDALAPVFDAVFLALQPGAYCCAVVMDLRKGSRFYPFHSDLAELLQRCGFIYDDLIIWDRRLEYNLLRPLGYPCVFRINKVHEFVIVARKPRQ